MKIIKLDNNNQEVIKQTLKVLHQGGLVIYPTETIYGLGVDATNQQAVDKLLAFKSRREGKPLSIAVASQAQAQLYADLNQQAIQFYQRFLPGPYTIISKCKSGLAKGVASEFNTLGVRIPDHQLILQLIKQFQKPITATSANASDKKRPYSIDDIFSNISNKQKNLIDLVIDAGVLPKNEPSTVIDTTHSTPLTLRSSAKNVKSSDTTVINSNSDQETKEIAGKLVLKNWSKVGKSGLVIALNGELGAGKTIFAKGIAKFLGVKQTITSPTYTYIKEYEYQRHDTQGTFYHLDLWRVEEQELANQLEINKLIKKNSVVVIEWWDQVEQFFLKLKPNLKILIEVETNDQRKLEIYE